MTQRNNLWSALDLLEFHVGSEQQLRPGSAWVVTINAADFGAIVAGVRDAAGFMQDLSKQLPEKPDYWSSCGQCNSNIVRAGELIEKVESHD